MYNKYNLKIVKTSVLHIDKRSIGLLYIKYFIFLFAFLLDYIFYYRKFLKIKKMMVYNKLLIYISDEISHELSNILYILIIKYKK
jgi:hypothetical protein